MRILFGVLSLLVVLAVLGGLAKTQLLSLPKGAAPPSGTASGSAADAAAMPQAIQQKFKDDVSKLMQAAPQRGEPQP